MFTERRVVSGEGGQQEGQDTGQVLGHSREAASSGGGSRAGPKAPGSARTPCRSRGRPGLWLTGKPGRSRTHSPGAHGPGGKRAGLPRPCFLLSHPSRSPAPHQPTGCRTSSDTSWGGQPGCPRGSSPSSVLPLPSLSLACWPLRLPACVGAQPRASLLPFLGGKAAGSGSAGLRPRAVPREPSGPALGALQCLQPPLCLWEES